MLSINNFKPFKYAKNNPKLTLHKSTLQISSFLYYLRLCFRVSIYSLSLHPLLVAFSYHLVPFVMWEMWVNGNEIAALLSLALSAANCKLAFSNFPRFSQRNNNNNIMSAQFTYLSFSILVNYTLWIHRYMSVLCNLMLLGDLINLCSWANIN